MFAQAEGAVKILYCPNIKRQFFCIEFRHSAGLYQIWHGGTNTYQNNT